MGALLVSAPFWGAVAAIIGPLLLLLAQRGFARKDKHLEAFDAQIVKLRDEADRETKRLELKYIEKTEEVMELRAECRHQGRVLRACEEEVLRLKAAGGK